MCEPCCAICWSLCYFINVYIKSLLKFFQERGKGAAFCLFQLVCCCSFLFVCFVNVKKSSCSVTFQLIPITFAGYKWHGLINWFAMIQLPESRFSFHNSWSILYDCVASQWLAQRLHRYHLPLVMSWSGFFKYSKHHLCQRQHFM